MDDAEPILLIGPELDCDGQLDAEPNLNSKNLQVVEFFAEVEMARL